MSNTKNETIVNDPMNLNSMTVSRDKEIEMVIGAKYSIGAQIAILRQKDTKSEEYQAFFAFAEKVKADVTAARTAAAMMKK